MAPLIPKKIGDFFIKIPVLIRNNHKFFLTGLITFLLSFIIMIIIILLTTNSASNYIDKKNLETKQQLQAQIQVISTTIADTVLPYISFLNQERKFVDSSLLALSFRVDSTQNRLTKFEKKYKHDNKFLTSYIATRDGFSNPDSLSNYAANICMNVYGRMLDELQSRIPPQEPSKSCDEETKVKFDTRPEIKKGISIRIDEKK